MAEPGAGVFADADLRAAVEAGWLHAEAALIAGQIQPASVDLRLGASAYRVRTSFLPGPGVSVAERLEDVSMHTLDLEAGAVLERGCVYVVPLQEGLALPPDVAGRANPKSSTGRLDVFTRVVSDEASAFDTIRPGYRGPLYAEISPRTFSVLAHAGDRVGQLRLVRGQALISDAELQCVLSGGGRVDHGLVLSLDGHGAGHGGLIGYRAKRHAGLVDLSGVGAHDPRDFWEPLEARGDGRLILDPGEFYILASREAVEVPARWAAEMAPFVAEMGEFRVHYAGFFDPGFGMDEAGGRGARAVLEVRSRDVPFLMEHAQPVARLVYERLTRAPDGLYGAAGSHYQAQGLKLSKHFAPWIVG